MSKQYKRDKQRENTNYKKKVDSQFISANTLLKPDFFIDNLFKITCSK